MKQFAQPGMFIAALITLVTPQECLSQALSWEQTSGPHGGSVYALAVDGAERVYAGTYQTGLFRSTNAGDRWTRSNISGTSFNALAVNQNGHIFTGTDGAIYRSTNGGTGWQLLTVGLENTAILSLSVGSQGTLFAGSGGSRSGVHRSSNNGDSWSLVGLPGQQVYSLAISQNGNVLAGTYYSGIWKSTDGGDTWSPTSVSSGFVMSLVAVPSNTILGGLYVGGVIRSTDNGDSWTQVGLSAMTVRSLARDSSGGLFAASTDSGAYRSTDNGTSWIFSGLSNHSLSSLSVSPTGKLFAGALSNSSIPGGSDGGVFRSIDNGITWAKVGLPNTTVPALTIPGTGPSVNNVFAGADTVVFRSSDNGDTWLRTGTLPHSGFLVLRLQSMFTSSSGVILAGTSQWGIYRTSDNGTSWTQVGLNNETVFSFVEDFSGNIYASTNNVVSVSTDGGSDWLSTGGTLPGSWLSSLAMNSGGDMFVGLVNRSDSSYLYRSTNNGQSWIPTGMTSYPVMALVITDGDTILAGCAAFFFGGGVFRSTDNGATWTEVSSGLINKDIRVLVRNSLGHTFAGTGGGVFRSTNNGDLWEPVNDGLTFASIQSLAMDVSGVLFAGTFAGGVFRTTQSTTSIRESGSGIPQRYSLEQNYPNPFNPTTTLQFTIVNRQSTIVKVYDVLGRDIATLVNEVKEPGVYTVRWDATGVASGVYFYRMQAGTFAATRKLLLLR